MKHITEKSLILFIFVANVILFSVSCTSGIDQNSQSTGGDRNEQIINEAHVALQEFAAGIGMGDPNRQMDADVFITDRLDAGGSYSVRISSYNLKSVYDKGTSEGLLIDGIFQIQSDIEELNSLSQMIIFMSSEGDNFAIVNGEKTEPHTDFLFFVACTRIPEKVAEIDKIHIKSADIDRADGETEYTILFDGEGLYSAPDLFNLFVINTFREEAARFEVGNMEYIFSVDEKGVPKSFFIRVSANPIDKEENPAYINAEVNTVYKAFEDVIISAFEDVIISVPETG
jgi:hypothetical protein